MPPVSSRQTPPKAPPPTPAAPPDSILATAVPVTALRREFIKVCFYGRNRSGKTTLAAQLRKPSLFISCEPDANGGADSIASKQGVFLQRVSHKLLGQDKDGQWVDATDPLCVRKDTVKGAAKVVALANALKGKHSFKTVVLDTVTSLQDLILVELMGLPKVPEMMSWGMVPDGMYQSRAEKLRETIRPLLDVDNCNVVIIAQEKDHNAGEDRGGKNKVLMGSAGYTMQLGSFMAPALGATNAQWLQDNTGYVIQVYEDEVTQEVEVPQFDGEGRALPPTITRVGTGKRQRHLRLLYHPNFAAGCRMEYDPDMPEFVTAKDPTGLYKELTKWIPALK